MDYKIIMKHRLFWGKLRPLISPFFGCVLYIGPAVFSPFFGQLWGCVLYTSAYYTRYITVCKSTQNTDFFLNPIFGFETEVNVDVKIKVIVLYSKEDMVINIAQVNERLRQKFNHILQKKKTCHGN